MAGVTFCLATTLGPSPSRPDSAAISYSSISLGAHCSTISLRLKIPVKKIHYSRSNRRSCIVAAAEVPDFLPATWAKPNKPIGPTSDVPFSNPPYYSNFFQVRCGQKSEQVTLVQLNALKDNDIPYADHGIEVMYRFAGFDPFKRSEYFGPLFDLGQFERFRRILHHTSFRVLLGHTDRQILSSLFVDEHCFKQRVWIAGSRPGEEEIYEFTLVQRVGGNWDGYWLTESLRHDGEGASGGIAY